MWMIDYHLLKGTLAIWNINGIRMLHVDKQHPKRQYVKEPPVFQLGRNLEPKFEEAKT